MTTICEITILVVNLISILISIPGYMFIVVVNTLDWMKNERLDISDQLISGIGLLMLIHRSFHAIVDFVGFTKGYLTTRPEQLLINLLYLSIIFCTLLFSTWLSIHFCLKIVNVNHNLYISIQRMFPKMFPWILLPSVLASLVISAPVALNLAQRQRVNRTVTPPNPEYSFIELYCAPYIMFSSFCFLVFFSSALSIILSLQRHIRQIHNNSLGSRAQIVEAHVTAVKKLLSLLVFNLFYFVLLLHVLVLNVSGQWTEVFPFLFALCHVLGIVILIRGSSKLQKKVHAIWRNFISSTRC